jgi:hypothetical protein
MYPYFIQKIKVGVTADLRLLTKYNISIVFVKMHKSLLLKPSSERKGDRKAVEGACATVLF